MKEETYYTHAEIIDFLRADSITVVYGNPPFNTNLTNYFVPFIY